MKLGFTELPAFMRWRDAEMDPEDYFQLQTALMKDPEAGAPIPGCGGLRKVRCANRRQAKGSRGGFRIIYLHVPEAKRVVLVIGYSKTRSEDLTAEEKRILSSRADEIRREEVLWARKRP